MNNVSIALEAVNADSTILDTAADDEAYTAFLEENADQLAWESEAADYCESLYRV